MRPKRIQPAVVLVSICLVLALGAPQAFAGPQKSTADISFHGKSVKGRSTMFWNFTGFERFFRLAQKCIQPVFPVLVAPVVETEPGELDQATYYVLGKPTDPSEGDPPSIIDGQDPY